MTLLVCFLVHGVACAVALADLSARLMTNRSRIAWAAAVVAVPVIGAVCYAGWRALGGAGRGTGRGPDAEE